MKLLAVVAVVTMMAGIAVAGTIQATKGKVMSDRTLVTGSQSRALDCGTVVDLGLAFADIAFTMGPDGYNDWFGDLAYIGPEIIFHATFPASDYGYNWSFSWVEGDCDVDFFLLDQVCDESTVWWYSAGGEGLGGVSATGWEETELYFVMDSEFCTGDYILDVTWSTELYIPFDLCPDVIETVTGSGVFYGDTCDGYETPQPGCVLTPPNTIQWLADGLEDYYGIFMPAGSSFLVLVTSDVCDVSLRVYDACMEPVNCIGYMDYQYPAMWEELPFTNDTGLDGMFYLIVDAYDPACCGTYEMDFTSTGGAIANEEMSMGAVKALWR
jgi:hypothetical protein